MQGSPSPNAQSPASTRLWRPAAQRNLRNVWSKIVGQKAAWASASSKALKVASSLVNAHLSSRYMSTMDLGILKEIDGICDKAQSKLLHQQEEYLCKLRSCYKDSVDAVLHMFNASKSMRTYVKGSAGSPLVEFCNDFGLDGDNGDGGGLAIFSSLSIQYFENLGEELVEMFVLELKIKRLLVVEFHSIVFNEAQEMQPISVMGWSDEMYSGEFDCVKKFTNFCKIDDSTLPSQLNWLELDQKVCGVGWSKVHPKREVLQVYLTTWLAEVNIKNSRIEEILSMVQEEMQLTLTRTFFAIQTTSLGSTGDLSC
ncbi:hypothetical protein SUGI_1025210 [Cryptomeria japonica]|nr:hypothetical protein SUGI_1025210 [Cryptomeria japonica]